MKPSDILNDRVKEAIVRDCMIDVNNERCGFVLKDLSVIPVTNISEKPNDSFIPEQESFDRYEDDIIAIYHSHNTEYTPGYLSLRDIEQSRSHQIPYIMYHTTFDVWDMFDADYIHPYPLREPDNYGTLDYLLNVPFSWARADCAWLIRAYYKMFFTFDITDYPRPLGDDWYKEASKSSKDGMYYDLLLNHPGLTQVNTETPKKGDIVLMRSFGSRVANHSGVVVESATSDRYATILHTLESGTFSRVDLWSGPRWHTGRLHSVWRLSPR
jgi:proteasome lid subunit RPN8/RPN11